MPRPCERRTGVCTSIAATLALLLLGGPIRALAQSPAPTQLPQIQADPSTDPEGFLREVLNRCDSLDSYRITMQIRERRGAFGSLSKWDRIQVDYRKDPKMVRMTWLNPDSEYAQAIYVEGRNNDKMEVVPRHGFLGFAPKPFWIEPPKAVSYGKSLRPITDVGLSEMIRTTLREIQQARAMGPVRITYAGQASPPDLQEPAYLIVIHYPPGYGSAARQDIYISTRTGHPIASYQWQPSGKLLAAYLYSQPLPASQ